MPIKIKIPVSPEVLTYDNVFMTGIHITQEPTSNGNVPARYDISIDYKVYAQNISGTRVFDRSNHSVSVVDYLQAAQAKAGLGDSSMLEAFTAIEKVVSLLITDKGNTGDTEVVLYVA